MKNSIQNLILSWSTFLRCVMMSIVHLADKGFLLSGTL